MKSILFSLAFIFSISIYSFQLNDIDGNSIALNQYQGKKILFVNIATGSQRVSQLAELQQLQQMFPDSLVVIGFPSNSFGNEQMSNAQIKQFCQTNYGTTFKLAAKDFVTGTNIQPIYGWLTKVAENGMLSEEVHADFQKYLVNESGTLIGFFSASTKPLSPEIIAAIREN